MGRSAAGPPGRWYLGPNLLSAGRADVIVPYPGAGPCDPGLSLTVLDRGARLGSAGPWELRRYGDVLFPTSAGGTVWGPLADPLPFLRVWAEAVLPTPAGYVYLWSDLCASEDLRGRSSPLYSTFDEWVWAEAVRVDSGELPDVSGSATRYHLHEWSGAWFVSVDPLPTVFRSFDSRNGVLLHAVRMVRHPD